MTELLVEWLPQLVTLNGNWDKYVDTLYKYYHFDFVVNPLTFENRPVYARFKPAHQDKGFTFWHLISEGEKESERTPDLKRCERIRWPRSIIERANTSDICTWNTQRPYKGTVQTRVNFSTPDFDYIVVLAENVNCFYLITAYPVDSLRKREKLRREWKENLRQKKEGSVD